MQKFCAIIHLSVLFLDSTYLVRAPTAEPRESRVEWDGLSCSKERSHGEKPLSRNEECVHPLHR